MTDLLLKDEVFNIVGAAFEVYNQLGSGFLEAVYQEALQVEFRLRQIPHKSQVSILINYKGEPLHQTYLADFLVYDQIIVELKALRNLGPIDDAQLLNYLKASDLKVGVLLNFGAPRKLEWKRMVF